MKKIVSIMLSVTLLMTVLLAGCGGKTDTSSTDKVVEKPSDKPDTWIADRHIVLRTFDEDIGLGLPDDQINNEVAQKIKELTGITFEIEHTAANSSKEALMTTLASGDLPDAIYYYLNHSARPEMGIVLKGAREGLFADVAPYLKETKVYSKYFEPGFLPTDSFKNIIQRPEFNGATYIVHMRIQRTETAQDYKMRGGMYIQKDIADTLGIKGWEIKTQDDLYELLKKIKDGNFKDVNGKTVTPLGPSLWGGRMRHYANANFTFASDGSFGIVDGKIVHESETDLVMKQIDFFKKLLNEDLIHPEFFTMDGTRAEEACRSNSFAIIEDVHNYIDMFEDAEYYPVGPLLDYEGEDIEYEPGKAGYCAWSIASTAKRPEEIVKFADFMASKEGKLLWQYGIEGKHYDMVDGKPMVKQEILDLVENDPEAAMQLNIYMGGAGSQWGIPFGNTDNDFETDFGELIYGSKLDPTKNKIPLSLYNYGREERQRKVVYTEGFSATAYLNDWENAAELKPILDSYDDLRIKAIYSKSMDEAKKIFDNYRKQLKNAGIEEFENYLMKLYEEDPKQLKLR
ncbi:extracellular solute-binding protein [Vallitalea sediminicola]